MWATDNGWIFHTFSPFHEERESFTAALQARRAAANSILRCISAAGSDGGSVWPCGEDSLDEQIVHRVNATAQRVLDWQHSPVRKELGDSLERVLKVLAGHWVCIWEGRQHRALAVGSGHPLVRHRVDVRQCLSNSCCQMERV